MKTLPQQELLNTHEWKEFETGTHYHSFICQKCRVQLAYYEGITSVTYGYLPRPPSWRMRHTKILWQIHYSKDNPLDPEAAADPFWWTCEYLLMKNALE